MLDTSHVMGFGRGTGGTVAAAARCSALAAELSWAESAGEDLHARGTGDGAVHLLVGPWGGGVRLVAETLELSFLARRDIVLDAARMFCRGKARTGNGGTYGSGMLAGGAGALLAGQAFGSGRNVRLMLIDACDLGLPAATQDMVVAAGVNTRCDPANRRRRRRSGERVITVISGPPSTTVLLDDLGLRRRSRDRIHRMPLLNRRQIAGTLSVAGGGSQELVESCHRTTSGLIDLVLFWDDALSDLGGDGVPTARDVTFEYHKRMIAYVCMTAATGLRSALARQGLLNAVAGVACHLGYDRSASPSTIRRAAGSARVMVTCEAIGLMWQPEPGSDYLPLLRGLPEILMHDVDMDEESAGDLGNGEAEARLVESAGHRA